MDNNEMSKEEAMYLDYVNNFITVECFADYYGISPEEALIIIEKFRTK